MVTKRKAVPLFTTHHVWCVCGVWCVCVCVVWCVCGVWCVCVLYMCVCVSWWREKSHQSVLQLCRHQLDVSQFNSDTNSQSQCRPHRLRAQSHKIAPAPMPTTTSDTNCKSRPPILLTNRL